MSGSGPLRVSASDRDGAAPSWLKAATARPAASRPEIDQPAAPGADTGSPNTTRMVPDETAVAPATKGGWPSASPIVAFPTRGFWAASRTAAALASSEPVAPGPAGSPPNATVWTAVPFPSRPETGRGSPPEDSATDAYAPGPARTGSVYLISASPGPETTADTTRGAIPSATLVDDATSPLPAASSTLPPAAGWYERVTASGVASGSGPSRTSASEADGAAASWLEATERPAASRPEIDQPSAPAPGAATGSSNSTSMVSGETAVAPATEGGWPSASMRAIVPLPSRMLDPDDTAAPSMSTLPVALGGAPPGENVSVWMWVPLPSPPSSPATVLFRPSTTSDA